MACKKFDKIIDKYVEGLATLEEKKALEKHVECCRACKQEVDGLKGLLESLNSFESMDLPEDFLPTLHNRLLKLKDERRKAPTIIISLQRLCRYNFKGFAFGMATVILAFFLIHFGVMPDINRQGAGGNPVNQKMTGYRSRPSLSVSSPETTLSASPKAESKVTTDAEKAYEKMMMTKNFQIAATTKSQTQGRTVARGGDHMTRSLVPENKKPEEVEPKDAALTKIDMQQEALRENGLGVASAKLLSQEAEKSEELTFYAEDFDRTVVQVLSLADKSDGSIEESKIFESNGESARRAYMVLKVPKENSTKTLEQIKALGGLSVPAPGPQMKSLTVKGPEKAEASQKEEALSEKSKIGQAPLEQGQKEQASLESKELKERALAQGSDVQKPMTIIRINIIEKPSNPESESN